MTEHSQLESIANEIIEIYNIQSPPIPVERMLQHPVNNIWQQLDISQVSSSFVNIKDAFNSRMSLARLLAKTIITSEWGQTRISATYENNPELMRAFARMLMMPKSMIDNLNPNTHTAERLSSYFEVPREEAVLRLQDLGIKKTD